MKLITSFKPPCPQCPYALGQVQFVDNPCPNCKLNSYQMYYMLTKEKYMPRGSMPMSVGKSLEYRR